jgi:sialic acid synthase SpsE
MIDINGRGIGEGYPVYIVCEISANHAQRFEYAVELIKTAKAAGADAVKVQLYTPATHTLPIDTEGSDFWLTSGLWKGNALWSLYEHTYMPWAWYGDLLQLAQSLDITLFPTVSDLTALEYAEKYDTVAYKVASFEIGDRTLLRRVAETGKPMIISMGCATNSDFDFIDELPNRGQILRLHCISEYPATATKYALEGSHELDGISDHTAGIGFPILCAVYGAHVIEKHLWLGRGDCADREFSLNPTEFKTMVDAIRGIEAAGAEMLRHKSNTKPAANFQRSIYVVRDIKKGETLTPANIRLVRPGYGLDPRLYESVLGKTAAMDIPYGTALKENYYK